MTLNWKSIELYDLPPMTLILLRFDVTHRTEPIYVVGAIDVNGFLFIDSESFDRYDGMRCDKLLKDKNVKSVYYIGPRKILL